MKKACFIFLVLILSSNVNHVFGQSSDVTRLMFIRHAEKIQYSGMDPGLTEEGITRAENWAEFFERSSVDAIYSTKTKRTLSTAAPISEATGLDIIVYDARTVDINKIALVNAGKTIVIVGHSNTIPNMVNTLLGEEKYELIDDNEYGNLFVVTVENGKATSGLMNIK
jgi:broad specificity phosphatase PhoE